MRLIYLIGLFFSVWFFWGMSKLFILVFCIFHIKKNDKTLIYFDSFPFERSSGHNYRVMQWELFFNKIGISTKSITTEKKYSVFIEYTNGPNLSIFIRKALFIRFFQLLKFRKYQCAIVRRELLLFNDYGNLFMEKMLLKIFPNAILDFDDDIAASKQEPRPVNTFFGKMILENGSKFTESLRLYNKFIVASSYLKQMVLDINHKISPDDVLVIPTCVNYDQYMPKQYNLPLNMPVLGWIGGDYNYHQLDELFPVLNHLSLSHTFKLLVIGGNQYIREANFPIEFIPWSLETEVDSLYKIDFGLMPLTDNAVNRGKGGFKLIQYMGLGIVSIASPITINSEIVEHGVDSFLAETPEQWEEILKMLLENKVDIIGIGKKAREKIMKNYTFEANKDKYLSFIERCAGLQASGT